MLILRMARRNEFHLNLSNKQVHFFKEPIYRVSLKLYLNGIWSNVLGEYLQGYLRVSLIPIIPVLMKLFKIHSVYLASVIDDWSYLGPNPIGLPYPMHLLFQATYAPVPIKGLHSTGDLPASLHK